MADGAGRGWDCWWMVLIGVVVMVKNGREGPTSCCDVLRLRVTCGCCLRTRRPSTPLIGQLRDSPIPDQRAAPVPVSLREACFASHSGPLGWKRGGSDWLSRTTPSLLHVLLAGRHRHTIIPYMHTPRSPSSCCTPSSQTSDFLLAAVA